MNERHEEIASAVPVELDSVPRLEAFRLRGMQMTRLEHPGERGDRVAGPGAPHAQSGTRLEWLGLFVDGDSRAGLFHVSQRVDGKSVKGKVMNVRQTKMLAESKSLRSQQGSCRPASPVYGPVAPPVRTGCA